MAESAVKSYFPSQVVSDAEKLSYDYGLKLQKLLKQSGFTMTITKLDIQLIKTIIII